MILFSNKDKNNYNFITKVISVFLALMICIVSLPIISFADQSEIMEETTEGETEPYILQELEEYRTIDTKQFIMSDNTIQVVMYNEPIHYKEDGEWEDLDNSLEYQKSTNDDDFNGYKTKNGSFDVKFAKDADSDKLVTISEEKYSLSWNLLNKSKITSAINKIDIEELENSENSTLIEQSVENASQSVSYKSIIRNTDLEYTVNGNGLKENIIVNKPLDDYTFSFEITADNLKLSLQEDYSIIAVDIETEECIYTIPTMFMYDSIGESCEDINISLNQDNETTYILTIDANGDWINDENREFPIVIDPQIKSKQVDESINISCISSVRILTNLANDNNCILGGYDLNYGFTRLLLQFDLPKLEANDMIVDANLNLYEIGLSYSDSKMDDAQINAYMVKSFWSNATTWAVQPVYDLQALDYEFLNKSDKATIDKGKAVLKSWNITKAVKAWYEGEEKNNGIVLKDHNVLSDGGNIFGKFAIDSGKNTNAYPFLTISYKNNKGLENYWTYTSVNAGSNDNAYINDYSGNVVVSHTDVQTTGNRMPVTIEHIYNSCNASQLYTNIYPSCGLGWKLNIQQTIRSSKLYGLTGTSQKNFPYVYEDGDGTEHYFYAKTDNNTTKYYDEDGLGLELKVLSNGYQIIDKNKNITSFNSSGNITEFRNNQKVQSNITVAYSDFKLNGETVSSISKITDGSGHIIHLDSQIVSDDNGNESLLLDSITDETNIVTYYSYETDNTLKNISSSINGKTSYEYTTLYSLLEQVYNNKSEKHINFNYKTILYGKRLLGVNEYQNSNKVYGISYDRHILNETKITTSLRGKSNITYIQFDNAGRTLSTYNEQSDKYLFYASKNTYNASSINSSGSNIKQINTLAATTNTQANTENLLKNPSAEYDGGWKASQAVGQCTFTNSYETNVKYTGNRSFKIVSTASTNDGRARLYQDLKSDVLEAGKTYTLSAYVKTVNIKQASTKYDYGALLIVTTNADKAMSYSSNYIKETTSLTAINGGWQRISVTFNIPENMTSTRVNLALRNATGTVYYDNVQLEEGESPSNFNLLENSCMRYVDTGNSLPYRWSAVSAVDDRCDLENPHLYFSMSGKATKNKYIYQDVPITGKESDTYTISGWASANASCSANSDREFDICIKITYSDKSTVWKPAAKFNAAVNEWQYAMQTFDLSDGTSANKTPISIRIYPRYKNQINSVSFSNFQLIKNNGNAYTYDANGNLTSATSGYANSSQNTYSGNNITKSVDCFGYETNYTYDSYDNLKSSVSQRNVSTNYTYDNYGNATSIVNADKGNTVKITTDTVYNDADFEKGINAGSYKTKVTDEDNNTTQYNYDVVSGNLNSVTDPFGNTTNFKYNSDDSLSQMSNGEVTNSYEYTSENLSSITRTNSDDSAQTYYFTYDKYSDTETVKIADRLLSNYIYDQNSKVSTTTYGNGDTVSAAYSDTGLLSSKSLNDTQQYKWQYDKSGNVYKYTDNVNGLYSTYDYDTMNRVSTKTVYSSDHQQKSITNFVYDLKGNVTGITNKSAGMNIYQNYTYTKDNLVTRSQMTSTQYYDYSYDSLNRMSKKSLHIGDNTINIDYAYKLSNRNTNGIETYRTRKLQREIIDKLSYRYYYDKNGNMVSVDQGVRDGDLVNAKDYFRKITYQYDSLNQLTREDNKYLNQTIVYSYDGVGNITQKDIYPYTTGNLTSEPTKSIEYAYQDDTWKDLLTSYDGKVIEYDEIGNPTTYLDNTLEWQGRELSSFSNDKSQISYTYDANGLRVSKTVDGVKTYYEYSGDKLQYQEKGEQKLYFWYDAFGNLSKVYCDYGNGSVGSYIVVCNSRGDVDTLYTVTGEIKAKYTYDSWGNTISVTDANGKEITSPNHIGNINPIRYRGYYYDTETGLYYLQSRYYNPQVGRFLNADVYCDTQSSILGTNMFAYCGNNPICSADPSGFLAAEAAGGTALYYFFTYVLPEIIIGGVALVSGIILVYVLIEAIADAIENAESEVKLKDKKKEPIVFPIDPNNFNPIGLTKIYRKGTKNGLLISWMDPLTNTEVFRWDENINRPNGPHYHIYGSGHYIPGISYIPEPYATIYFPGK